MRVSCPRCGYEWDTRSRRRYLVCPYCYRSFRNPFWGSSNNNSNNNNSNSSSNSNNNSNNENLQRLADKIEVDVLDFDPVLWERFKEVAEEASTPDPSGIEVLVLSKSMFDKVMRDYVH